MKSLMILFLLSVLAFNTKGQVISNYGLKLGIGISNQSWDYQAIGNLDWKNKTGLSARIFADFFNLPIFQLEGEIGYIRKGVTDKIPVTTEFQPFGTGELYTIDNGLDYLTLSALGKLKHEFKFITPYIIEGPQLNILLNKNIQKGYEVVFDKFKKNIAGISFGAGAEVRSILPFVFLLEYRF